MRAFRRFLANAIFWGFLAGAIGLVITGFVTVFPRAVAEVPLHAWLAALGILGLLGAMGALFNWSDRNR